MTKWWSVGTFRTEDGMFVFQQRLRFDMAAETFVPEEEYRAVPLNDLVTEPVVGGYGR